MKTPVIRPMSKREYANAIEALGLTQQEAARLLGFKERMGRYYASGEHQVPATVSALLRLIVKQNITADQLEKLVA